MIRRFVPNTIGYSGSPISKTLNLIAALWPYRDYPEVRDEIQSLQRERSALQAPAVEPVPSLC